MYFDYEKPKVICNLSECQYEIIRHVVENVMQWEVVEEDEEEETDLYWIDTGMTSERLTSLKLYQKINHFPGMYSITRKDFLGNALNSMRRLFPIDYNFFPRTFILPRDYSELRAYNSNKKNQTFIVKPEASSQGRGIFLTRKLEEIPNKCVVQRYLSKPYLIDNLKFDLRLYVLVAGCDPLRIFLHKEGLTRFATEEYVGPMNENLANTYVHLTNYAVNKNNPKFVYNTEQTQDNVGHKWSLSAIKERLKHDGKDVDKLWSAIEALIIKTLAMSQPILSHIYRTCQENDWSNTMCFEVLGFDIILDSKLKPYLLEVNHTPSFSTDTPLDTIIKQQVITDTLTLLNISRDNHIKQSQLLKNRIQLRSSMNYSDFKVYKKSYKDNDLRNREIWEDSHGGGYTRIYPTSDTSQYDPFLEEAKALWSNMTGRKEKARKRLPEVKNDCTHVPKLYKSKYRSVTSRLFSTVEYNRVPVPKSLKLPSEEFFKPVEPKGTFVRPKLFEILPYSYEANRGRVLQDAGRSMVRVDYSFDSCYHI
jgi:tubulin polyglutamylase TTLL6/13